MPAGKKYGGRKKGTPNKVNKERREMLSQFLDDHWEEFNKMWERADEETKMKIYMDVLPYTTPKMASVEYKDKTPQRTFKDELDEDTGLKTR